MASAVANDELCLGTKATGPLGRGALLALGLLLGLSAAWANRFAMNPDGVSYLDLGDDLAAGDWRSFANAHWSPAYPALLGTTLRLLRPSPAWEFPAVHLVNFLVYLLALAAFSRFVTSMIAATRNGKRDDDPPGLVGPLDLLFFWSALVWVGLALVTPDVLVLAAALAALDVMLRTRARPTGGRAAALGLLLGVGYLCKAPLAWLGPVVIVGAFARRDQPPAKQLGRGLLAGAVFIATALPWVALLHQKYGRLTLSESARLNWIWAVEGSAVRLNWQGGPAGRPVHPTRIAQDFPRIYEFAAPVNGTYAPWKDPTYWMEGAVAHVRPGAVFVRVGPDLRTLGRGLWGSLPVGVAALIVVAGLVAAFQSGPRLAALAFLRALIPLWPVVLFGVAGIAMYLVVLIEMRYVAAFVLAIMAALVTAAGRAWFADSPRLGSLVAAASVVLFAVSYAPELLSEVHRVVALSPWGERLPGGPEVRRLAQYHVHVAEDLGRLGVRPGTPVGVMGEPALHAAWARLAGVRIVAELPPDQRPLLREPRTLERSLATFRRCGAADVVALLPSGEHGGTPVDESGLVLFRLR